MQVLRDMMPSFFNLKNTSYKKRQLRQVDMQLISKERGLCLHHGSCLGWGGKCGRKELGREPGNLRNRKS